MSVEDVVRGLGVGKGYANEAHIFGEAARHHLINGPLDLGHFGQTLGALIGRLTGMRVLDAPGGIPHIMGHFNEAAGAARNAEHQYDRTLAGANLTNDNAQATVRGAHNAVNAAHEGKDSTVSMDRRLGDVIASLAAAQRAVEAYEGDRQTAINAAGVLMINAANSQTHADAYCRDIGGQG